MSYIHNLCPENLKGNKFKLHLHVKSLRIFFFWQQQMRKNTCIYFSASESLLLCSEFSCIIKKKTLSFTRLPCFSFLCYFLVKRFFPSPKYFKVSRPCLLTLKYFGQGKINETIFIKSLIIQQKSEIRAKQKKFWSREIFFRFCCC
jgi:hypothetical protein